MIAATVPAATFLANLLPVVALPHADARRRRSASRCSSRSSPRSPSSVRGAGRLLGPMAAVSIATMVVLAIDVMTGSQAAAVLADGAAAGGRRPLLRHGQRHLRAVRHLDDPAVHRGVGPLRPGGPEAAGGRRRGRHRAGARSSSTVAGSGVPTAAARPPCSPVSPSSCSSILGVRMTWRRGALIGGVTAGLFLLVGFLDWLQARGVALPPRPVLRDDDPRRRGRHHRAQAPAEPRHPLRQLPPGPARADRAGLRHLRPGPADVLGLARAAALLRAGAARCGPG